MFRTGRRERFDIRRAFKDLPRLPTWYATQQPSGKNMASLGSHESLTSLNGVAFRSLSDNVQSDDVKFFVAQNSRTVPSGRPRFRHMHCVGFGFREALRCAAANGLPPHGRITLAIGFKRHTEISGPDREAVVFRRTSAFRGALAPDSS